MKPDADPPLQISRRAFLAGAPALFLQRRPQRVVIVMCDGFGPDYLAASPMPTLARWRRDGISKIVPGGMPAVTNTNNASKIGRASCRERECIEEDDAA